MRVPDRRRELFDELEFVYAEHKLLGQSSGQQAWEERRAEVWLKLRDQYGLTRGKSAVSSRPRPDGSGPGGRRVAALTLP